MKKCIIFYRMVLDWSIGPDYGYRHRRLGWHINYQPHFFFLIRDKKRKICFKYKFTLAEWSLIGWAGRYRSWARRRAPSPAAGAVYQPQPGPSSHSYPPCCRRYTGTNRQQRGLREQINKKMSFKMLSMFRKINHFFLT